MGKRKSGRKKGGSTRMPGGRVKLPGGSTRLPGKGFFDWVKKGANKAVDIYKNNDVVKDLVDKAAKKGFDMAKTKLGGRIKRGRK